MDGNAAGANETGGRLAAGHAMGLFVAVTFGSAYPVAKPLVAAVDPLVFGSARYLVAGALMLTLLAVRGAPVRVSWGDVPMLVLTGFLGYTVFQGVWGIALTMTSPAKAVVLVATTPIFGALIGAFGGERLRAPWLARDPDRLCGRVRGGQ